MARWTARMLLVGLAVLSAGCDDDPLDPEAYPVFEIDVVGQTFHVAVADEDVASELEALRASGEPAGVINGELRAGDGGFNAPYSWHIDPETLEVADMAMEVCDGEPDFVEDELDYWLETVKRYCPWGPKVVARTR